MTIKRHTYYRSLWCNPEPSDPQGKSYSYFCQLFTGESQGCFDCCLYRFEAEIGTEQKIDIRIPYHLLLRKEKVI